MTKYRLWEMTWPEAREAVDQRRLVLQPVAAIEQHGPHLPLDADNIVVTELCEAVGRAHPDEFVVAPCIPYGFNDHNMEFPGTVSIRPTTLLEYYFDVGHSFATAGFRRLIFVNGHGSNRSIAELAARRLTNETPLDAALIGQYDLAAVVEQRRHMRTSAPGGIAHACEFETSYYLHLKPELVREDLIADELPADQTPHVQHDWMSRGPLTFMSWYSERTHSGVDGAPSHASREKGKVLFEDSVALLAEIARDFRNLALQARTDHRSADAWEHGLRS